MSDYDKYTRLQREISLLRAGHRATLCGAKVGITWITGNSTMTMSAEGYEIGVGEQALALLQAYTTNRGLTMEFKNNAEILIRTINAVNEVAVAMDKASVRSITPLFEISFAGSGDYYSMLLDLYDRREP